MNLRTLTLASLLGLVPAAAFGQNFDSGSDGSDGALTFAPNLGNVEFDPAAQGINNTDRVYHFTTITVGAGTTVRLSAKTLGQGRAITWLASGAVTIAGTLDLDGRQGHAHGGVPLPADAGAGGWSGGVGRTALVRATGGNGPGGGLVGTATRGGNASHAILGLDSVGGTTGPVYGNVLLLPLTGGSGGAGSDVVAGAGGGSGGGAIVIASSVSITVTGAINARGGNGNSSNATNVDASGSGSGGGIRLVAPTLSGVGTLRVNGGGRFGSAGYGRVRLEAFTHSLTTVTPLSAATFARPGVVQLPANAPKLSVPSVTTSTGTVNVAANPQGSFEMPDVVVNTNQPLTLNLAAQNIPVGTQLSIRVIPEGGTPIVLTSTALSGTTANSTATAGPLTIPTGYTRFSITASFNP